MEIGAGEVHGPGVAVRDVAEGVQGRDAEAPGGSSRRRRGDGDDELARGGGGDGDAGLVSVKPCCASVAVILAAGGLQGYRERCTPHRWG